MKLGPIKLNKRKVKLISIFFIVIVVTSLVTWRILKQEEASLVFEKINLSDYRASVKFPPPVWEFVEKDYNRFITKIDQGQSNDGMVEQTGRMKVNTKYIKELTQRLPQVDPFEFKLYLIEQTNGALGGKNYEISFPAGGGKLDLNDYVTKKNGSFYFLIKWDLKTYPQQFSKIYFLSQSQQKQVRSEHWGSGCNSFFDITNFWFKTMDYKGLFLTTLNQRHIGLLAGTFYFNIYHQNKISAAQLVVSDSGNRNLLCADAL
ncbi:MAG: hypothetical protein IPM57_09320 [Oligoflexia bacterium]|nr:hypothetical protein [Oligoflexia bacterium]